ncbi:MAG: hypothetical protein HY565_05005 [Candidatus Kerfeldbacteria bacterium]|nr:hypothetical protein [Candidatus Kerfeldbacteria bacterium]
MKKYLIKLIVPACTLIILSSCFVLAWYLYTIAYLPLFGNATTTFTASDYALPAGKLDTVLQQLETKTTTPTDVSTLANPFVSPTAE